MITLNRFLRVPVPSPDGDPMGQVIAVVRMPTADEWGQHLAALVGAGKGEYWRIVWDLVQLVHVGWEGPQVVHEDGSPATLWEFGEELHGAIYSAVRGAVAGKRQCPGSAPIAG